MWLYPLLAKVDDGMAVQKVTLNLSQDPVQGCTQQNLSVDDSLLSIHHRRRLISGSDCALDANMRQHDTIVRFSRKRKIGMCSQGLYFSVIPGSCRRLKPRELIKTRTIVRLP